jgi:ketosteroid isomerase-like protein
MGRSRIEIVRELGNLMAAEDAVTRMNDPALLKESVEAVRQVAAPDFVFALVTPAAVGGTRAECPGVEGFLDGWHDWLAVFESFQVEIGEHIEAGDKVVSMARTRAVPKGTTAAIEGTVAAVFTFDGDQLSRLEFNLDQEAALRTLGLSE